MKKKVILMIIFLITVVFSGCKNEEKSIMENNNLETLESMKFSEQNINQGSDEVMSNSQESYINSDNENFTDISQDNVNDEIDGTRNENTNLSDISIKDEDSTQQIANVEVDGTQNENTNLSDIPTIDEDSAQQIANVESDKSLVMDKVNISLEDITRQTLVFYVENLSGEGIVIDKIYLKEYLNEQWIEIKTDGSQTKSPTYGLAPNGTGEIEYNFDAIYGELSKGEYICVIKINGELKEIKFEIK